jgi:hypothetical protein
MKTAKALIATTLFIVLLLVYYYIHSQYLRVDVVFYSAILDGILAVVTMSIILLTIPFFALFNGFEKLQMVIIWILGSYIFAISVPTVLDRSLSFYILEKIQQRGGGIKLSGFEEVFTKEYVKEHRLVDVRLTEQENSGTIIIRDDGCVKLTPKGDRLATYSRYFRKHYLPKHRLLMGEYSDDLTDPFGHGSIDQNSTFDYLCQ